MYKKRYILSLYTFFISSIEQPGLVYRGISGLSRHSACDQPARLIWKSKMFLTDDNAVPQTDHDNYHIIMSSSPPLEVRFLANLDRIIAAYRKNGALNKLHFNLNKIIRDGC